MVKIYVYFRLIVKQGDSYMLFMLVFMGLVGLVLFGAGILRIITNSKSLVGYVLLVGGIMALITCALFVIGQ